MKKQSTAVFRLLAASIGIALIMSGCGLQTQNSGTVSVTAMNLPEAAAWSARIVCTRGKHEITQCFTVYDTNLAVEFTIPAGPWDITLQLADSDGNVLYQDTAVNVVIYPDRPVLVDFQLKPAPGTVKVIVDLSGHPNAEAIMRARVYFNDQVKELIRSSVQEALEGEYRLEPGSYDFTVDLYTTSFHAHNRIDSGVWSTIDVEPLSEQTVIWRPQLEKMTVTACICVLPDAPQGLAFQYGSGRTVLSWEPSLAADLAGYHIYWQPSPFQRFSLIATVDRDATSYTHDLSELDELPLQAYYTVAPFSTVLEGYRSSPVLVPFL